MRINYPTYYEEAVGTDYPFKSGASRSNGTVVIENDVFVDGRLFPPLGRYDLFISEIVVGSDVVIVLSNGAGEVGRGSFNRATPPDYVTFSSNNVHIGILQGSPSGGLSKLAGWNDGTYAFTAAQTPFTASVVVPQPQQGVRAIVLDSGAVFAGDVTIVGERGVQFTVPRIEGSSSSDAGWPNYAGYQQEVIRMDVVGDPLFLRRGCGDQASEFQQDVLIARINFDGHVFTPDETGGFLITIAHASSNQPAVRLLPITNGLSVGFVER